MMMLKTYGFFCQNPGLDILLPGTRPASCMGQLQQ
jgi:hypothetical protein